MSRTFPRQMAPNSTAAPRVRWRTKLPAPDPATEAELEQTRRDMLADDAQHTLDAHWADPESLLSRLREEDGGNDDARRGKAHA